MLFSSYNTFNVKADDKQGVSVDFTYLFVGAWSEAESILGCWEDGLRQSGQ